MSNKNDEKLDGIKDKVKGNVKDAAGKVTGDKKKQAEGKYDKVKGEVKENINKIKDEKEDKEDKNE